MLALAPRPTAVYLCVGATDMRKGFDGLMRLAAEQAARDVLQGGLFVFGSGAAHVLQVRCLQPRQIAIW